MFLINSFIVLKICKNNKNSDGNPITKSRDCNEIDINNSILTLETFKNSN